MVKKGGHFVWETKDAARSHGPTPCGPVYVNGQVEPMECACGCTACEEWCEGLTNWYEIHGDWTTAKTA